MNKLLAVLFGIFGMGAASADKQFEASAGFDSDIVKPFLERLNTQLELELDVVSLITFTENVPHDDEQSRNIDVMFKGKKEGLQYRVFKDDPYAPDLYFFSKSEALTNAISKQFDLFFEERGM